MSRTIWFSDIDRIEIDACIESLTGFDNDAERCRLGVSGFSVGVVLERYPTETEHCVGTAPGVSMQGAKLRVTTVAGEKCLPLPFRSRLDLAPGIPRPRCPGRPVQGWRELAPNLDCTATPTSCSGRSGQRLQLRISRDRRHSSQRLNRRSACHGVVVVSCRSVPPHVRRAPSFAIGGRNRHNRK